MKRDGRIKEVCKEGRTGEGNGRSDMELRGMNDRNRNHDGVFER